MSRSYKKHPVFTSRLSTVSLSKKWANKKARRSRILANGNYYRKLYEQWAIQDYRDYMSKPQAEDRYNRIYSIHNTRYRPRYVTKKEYMDKYYNHDYKWK